MKYLPGGPPPPSNELSLLSFSRKSSPNELALWYSRKNTTKSTKNSDFGSPFGQSFLYGILFFEQKMCFFFEHLKIRIAYLFPHTRTQKEGSQERPDELISVDSIDFSGRPQSAQDTDYPRYAFPEL